MNAEEILQSFYAAYDVAREFDPKHPEDGVLSRKRDGLPPRPFLWWKAENGRRKRWICC